MKRGTVWRHRKSGGRLRYHIKRISLLYSSLHFCTFVCLPRGYIAGSGPQLASVAAINSHSCPSMSSNPYDHSSRVYRRTLSCLTYSSVLLVVPSRAGLQYSVLTKRPLAIGSRSGEKKQKVCNITGSSSLSWQTN